MSLIDQCDGELTIGGVLMHTPAWNAYQRRLTVTRHSLPMAIFGEVNQGGVPYANEWAGLEANIAYLKANVVAPTGTGDGTRAASLLMPSGATRTADIHVVDLVRGRLVAGTNMITGAEGVGMLATLEISIPEGEFT